MSRKDWSQSEINQVWRNTFGSASQGRDPRGRTISLNNYGENGWVIDHIKPVAKGGGDNMSNLQPLHNLTNSEKSDEWPTNIKY